MSILANLFQANNQENDYFPKTIPLKSTPYFVTDESVVSQRLSSIKESFQKHHFAFNVAFSFKTNYDFAKSDFLRRNHLFAETVSENEYRLAAKLGFKSSQIIINGPNKSNLQSILKSKSIIHLDNFSELDKLPNTGITAKIGIRLNTNSTHSRFGFDIDNEDALKAINFLHKKNIPLNSLHIHLGSDIYDPNLYKRAAVKVVRFILANKLRPTIIDFGGGYPAHGQFPYKGKLVNTPKISEYINAFITPLKKLPHKPTIIIEPGRFLIDDATLFVAKVINKTIKNKTQIITIDATINMLPSLWYRPPTIKLFTHHLQPLKTSKIKTVIYGSSCQEHDLMYQGYNLHVNNGDLVVFYAVGAYNQSQASDFIFPKPKTFFIR